MVTEDIACNVAEVRERIAVAARHSGRRGAHDEVRLVAATKYADVATIVQLLAAGVTDVAENRLDALVARQAALAPLTGAAAVRWHYIGALQSRKVPDIAARVAMVHALCTASAARRLATEVVDHGRAPQLLLQVNTAADPGKQGLPPDEVEPFIAALAPQLAVAGLMTMPARAADPAASRPAFAVLRELRDHLRGSVDPRHTLKHLSMGTTQDFEVAVEEGATLVRLGRVLYAAQD